jgi:hypothetical protein
VIEALAGSVLRKHPIFGEVSMRCIRNLALALSLVFTATILATPLAPFIDLQEPGLTVVADSAGLNAWSAPVTLTVNVSGTVNFALLYWAGRERPCVDVDGDCSGVTEPFKDQRIVFEGMPVTGTIIGSETQPSTPLGPVLNIGYFADVTPLVAWKGTGTVSFTVSDADPSSNLWRIEGVSLLVAFTDPASSSIYRVLVQDGLDFVSGSDPTAGGTRVAAPVNFSHGSAPDVRTAQLFAGIGGGGAATDELWISNNPTIFDSVDGSNGPSWDGDEHTISIPALTEGTTVQLSAPGAPTAGCANGFWKNNTESWPVTGFSPGQRVDSVFNVTAFPSLAGKTLFQALQFKTGKGTTGAAQVLLRAAVPALLNAAHPSVEYPRTVSAVIGDVNAVLVSGDRATMLALARELDAENNLPCALQPVAGSDELLWQFVAVRFQATQSADTSAPTCGQTIVPGPPAGLQIDVQDTGSGLAQAIVTLSENADTVVPPFIPGTTDAVRLQSTKIDQSHEARVAVEVIDGVGNSAPCLFVF